MKISKTILENIIREELRLLLEAPSDIPGDATSFVAGLTSRDPDLKQKLFFPVNVIGSKSPSGSLFYTNITRLAREAPDLLDDLKQKLIDALKSELGYNMPADSVVLARTKDKQWVLRLGAINPYSDRSAVYMKKLADLDWKNFVVMPAGQDPSKMKGATGAALKRGRVPTARKKQVKGSSLYKGTIGQLGGLRGILGLKE